MAKFIKIHENDNVAVALETIAQGETITVDDVTVTTVNEIPAGHKFALKDLPVGTPVVKYGFKIGNTTADVKAGEWIHTHNLKTGLGDLLDYSYEPKLPEEKFTEDVTFMGYNRENGKVGVRNEIWVIPTVGCVNNIASKIAELSKGLVRENIEAVCAFPHPYGCSQMGDDQEHTRQILANLINHPNAGGVLVLGLGCENSNIDVLKNYIGEYNPDRVKFLVCQESDDEITDGVEIVKELAEYASQFKREPISVSKLVIGMKCGGSDGFSGITANPTVGRFSDYFKSHNQTIYENPSPGNKKGGISTLEDKSLGCTQKSGSAIVKGVLAYGETVSTPGLNLLSAPGNDLVAATALAASGAHIVLFTTGRGTPFACPVPTMKISSNSRLAGKKDNWIDFNAGVVAEGEDLDTVGMRLFDEVVAVASGKEVKSEIAGFHDMAIFKQGVTL